VRRLYLLAAAALVAGAAAPGGDLFDFIPEGGRTLLAKTLAGKPANDPARSLVTGKRSRDEWLAYLRGDGKVLPGIGALDEKQAKTLADYLAHNMPLAAGKAPANPALANWQKALPLDGRDLTLEHCQSCHIITVVITQDRAKAQWLGTMSKPSHVGIKISPAQRDALADYLVLNAGIPIDQVPEDLRAGGATY
jgi:mono/diheme cytochrome c family protein